MMRFISNYLNFPWKHFQNQNNISWNFLRFFFSNLNIVRQNREYDIFIIIFDQIISNYIYNVQIWRRPLLSWTNFQILLRENSPMNRSFSMLKVFNQFWHNRRTILHWLSNTVFLIILDSFVIWRVYKWIIIHCNLTNLLIYIPSIVSQRE
jgi:hypothetical protein